MAENAWGSRNWVNAAAEADKVIVLVPQMTPKRDTFRPAETGLAGSASALIALVAVAALMTSLPGVCHVRYTAVETRTALTEGQTARELAAAVAAAARELVGGAERIVPQASALPVNLDLDASPALTATRVHFDPFELQMVRSRVMAERLIDLPPPVC